MSEKKRTVAPAAPAEEVAAEELAAGEAGENTTASAPVEQAPGTEVTVRYRDHRGEVTERVYSREVHGEKFLDLAEEFKAANPKAVEGLN